MEQEKTNEVNEVEPSTYESCHSDEATDNMRDSADVAATRVQDVSSKLATASSVLSMLQSPKEVRDETAVLHVVASNERPEIIDTEVADDDLPTGGNVEPTERTESPTTLPSVDGMLPFVAPTNNLSVGPLALMDAPTAVHETTLTAHIVDENSIIVHAIPLSKRQPWRLIGFVVIFSVLVIAFMLLQLDPVQTTVPNPAIATGAPDTTTAVRETATEYFTTTQQLYDAVDAYLAALQEDGTVNMSIAPLEFGYPVGTWDVSRLTNFSRVFDPFRSEALHPSRPFSRSTPFNEDLSGWDVSNATTMSGMFALSDSFEGIGTEKWNVANVIDFSYMFYLAYSFNGDTVTWNTSSATTMEHMFSDAHTFSRDVSQWDVSSVVNMASMFQSATSFAGDSLNEWDVSNVRTMGGMFGNSLFIGDVSSWDTGMVTEMGAMFWMTEFNGDLSRWRVDNVWNMNSMFYGAKRFEGRDLSQWNTKNVVDMAGIFSEAHVFNGDISSWDVSRVSHFFHAFSGSFLFDRDLSRWNTSNAVDTMNMFANAVSFNSDISSWDVSKVEVTYQMFYNAVEFNSDVSAWSLSSVTDASEMFGLASSFNQSLCEWNERIPSTAYVAFMFRASGCPDTSDPRLGEASVGSFCDVCETK